MWLFRFTFDLFDPYQQLSSDLLRDSVSPWGQMIASGISQVEIIWGPNSNLSGRFGFWSAWARQTIRLKNKKKQSKWFKWPMANGFVDAANKCCEYILCSAMTRADVNARCRYTWVFSIILYHTRTHRSSYKFCILRVSKRSLWNHSGRFQFAGLFPRFNSSPVVQHVRLWNVTVTRPSSMRHPIGSQTLAETFPLNFTWPRLGRPITNLDCWICSCQTSSFHGSLGGEREFD